MKHATTFCTLALALAGGSAHAIVNGIDPETTPVTHPTTLQPVAHWKLGGAVSGVSAVQLAPRWILASRHASPPAGAVFTNKYGQASVAACWQPPGAWNATGPNDISLCRLNAAIALPAGAAFPAITDVPAEGPAVAHWGHVLAVGYSTGARRAAWAGFDELPPNYNIYDVALNPTGNLIDVTATIPIATPGDSGGAAFFFPDNGSGYLAGVMTGGGYLGSSPTYLSAANTAWIAATVAGQGDAPPTVVPFQQLVPDTVSRLPRSMAGSTVAAAVTGATSLSLSWTAPPGSATDNAPATRYGIWLLSPDGAPPIVQLRYAPGTLTLNNLVDGKRYEACVLSGNDLGFRQSYGQFNTSTTRQIERKGCTYFLAGAPNVPQVPWDLQVTRNPATGKINLSGYWNAPVPNGVTVGSYFVTVKIWPSWTVAGSTQPIRTSTVHTYAKNFSLPNLVSGTEYACWSVAARSVSQTQGAGSTGMCFSANSVLP